MNFDYTEEQTLLDNMVTSFVRDNYDWCLLRIMQLPQLLVNNEYIGELHGQDHYTVFKQWHTELDKIRGTSFYDTFPVFKEFE